MRGCCDDPSLPVVLLPTRIPSVGTWLLFAPLHSFLSLASNQLTGSVPVGLTTTFPLTSLTWSSNCLTNCSNQYPDCSMPERAALVDLYTATAGTAWANSTRWLTSVSLCNWTGVTCGSPSGPVVYVWMVIWHLCERGRWFVVQWL